MTLSIEKVDQYQGPEATPGVKHYMRSLINMEMPINELSPDLQEAAASLDRVGDSDNNIDTFELRTMELSSNPVSAQISAALGRIRGEVEARHSVLAPKEEPIPGLTIQGLGSNIYRSDHLAVSSDGRYALHYSGQHQYLAVLDTQTGKTSVVKNAFGGGRNLLNLHYEQSSGCFVQNDRHVMYSLNPRTGGVNAQQIVDRSGNGWIELAAGPGLPARYQGRPAPGAPPSVPAAAIGKVGAHLVLEQGTGLVIDGQPVPLPPAEAPRGVLSMFEPRANMIAGIEKNGKMTVAVRGRVIVLNQGPDGWSYQAERKLRQPVFTDDGRIAEIDASSSANELTFVDAFTLETLATYRVADLMDQVTPRRQTGVGAFGLSGSHLTFMTSSFLGVEVWTIDLARVGIDGCMPTTKPQRREAT